MYVSIFQEFGKGYRFRQTVASVYIADIWIKSEQALFFPYAKFATIVALTPYEKPVVEAKVIEHFPGQTYPSTYHQGGKKIDRSDRLI